MNGGIWSEFILLFHRQVFLNIVEFSVCIECCVCTTS